MAELLAPAGSIDSLKAAVNAGADAVYIGGSRFGARAYAENPSEEQLLEGIDYCHIHDRKLYMTVNTLIKEQELYHQLYDFLYPYYIRGVDGLIVQDLGAVSFIQDNFPGLEVHSSTQMTITSTYGARLMQEQGITRVVPARELSLTEIKRIIDETGIEVETFIHGAMCYCYSGQCLLSSVIGGRSGNRGRCAQPCRLPYSLNGVSKKPSCLLSMKDMCALSLLPDILDAGIASLKIEGRMKRPEYTAGVVSIYRKYMDLYEKRGRKEYHVREEDLRVLMDLYNRGGFSEGYYKMHNGKNMMTFLRPNHQGTEALKIQKVSKNRITANALEPLNKKDVIEVSPGNEITLSKDICIGEQLPLSVSTVSFKPGMVLFRTKNEKLLQELQDTYLARNIKEKIKGELRIFLNSPAILKLFYKDIIVCSELEGIADLAQNSATPLETIERQMRKTGNTPFEFTSLKVDSDPNLFVSIKGLNELRRNSLEKLYREILYKNLPNVEIRKNAKERPTAVNHKRTDRTASEYLPQINVLVTTGDQLAAVLECKEITFRTVYLDYSIITSLKDLEDKQQIMQLKQAGVKVYLYFPPVFREKEILLMQSDSMKMFLKQMDGVMVHTADELSFAKTLGKEIAASEYLYAYNSQAVQYLKKQGVSLRTLPAELNFKELMQLDNCESELNIYGHQPLMHSAQCLTRNTVGCTGKTELRFMKDRKNAEFPVVNKCAVCCNTIYNSVPLQLGGCREDIEKIAPQYLRLSFSIEDRNRTAQILKQYYDLLICGKEVQTADLEGTRGHFRRGVE